MSDDNAGWSLTESDPSVFSALLNEIGVKGLQVEDLYTFDEEATVGLGEIKALIFLFKYVNGIEEGNKAGQPDSNFPGFFCNQVINNACGSIAILNSVLNLAPSSPDASGEGHTLVLGDELDNLKAFTDGMDPMDKGHVVSNSTTLRAVHNSFARSDPFSIDPSLSSSSEKEDAYHFVTYLPVAGSLYELDGLQSAPRRHGAVKEGGQQWMEEARKVVRERIESYPMGALHFSLLALTVDPMPKLQRDLAKAKAAGNEQAAAMAAERVEDEERKRNKWAFENSLRRHNPISLIHQLLLGLAEAGTLPSAISAARTKGEEKRKAAAAKGSNGDEMEE